jgi:hypothetical protein
MSRLCPETRNNGPQNHGMPLGIGTSLPDPNDQYALVLVPANQGTLVRSLQCGTPQL